MHVLVVGAGLAGLSTAWALLTSGVSVSVVESAREPARGAAMHGGGYIGPAGLRSFVRPLSFSDRSWMRFSSTKASAPLRYSVSERSRWQEFSTEYVDGSSVERARNARRLLRSLGVMNASLLERLESESGFDAARKNVLHLFASQARWDRARLSPAEYLGSTDGTERFSAAGVRSMEPLVDTASPVAGALFRPDDCTIDGSALCAVLAGLCRSVGADFKAASPALALLARKDGSICGIETVKRTVRADAVVLACGLGALGLLRKSGIGLRVPGAPMVLCSVTARVQKHGAEAAASIIDEVNCVLYTSLGRRIRASGSPFLGDPSEGTIAAEYQRLIDCGTGLYGTSADFEGGMCASSTVMALPDGLPMVGAVGSSPGLWLNIGHGPAGLATALPCASLLARMMTGGGSGADPAALSPQRFTR